MSFCNERVDVKGRWNFLCSKTDDLKAEKENITIEVVFLQDQLISDISAADIPMQFDGKKESVVFVKSQRRKSRFLEE